MRTAKAVSCGLVFVLSAKPDQALKKLDDEPNDVGGLTSAQLKTKFDEAGNTIKTYINDTLIPAILTDDATEDAREAALSPDRICGPAVSGRGSR